MIEPKIVQKPALKVIGLEATFISALSPEATNFKVIPPLWEKFMHRASEVSNKVGKEMVGIITDVPEQERSRPHECRYLAGVLVQSTLEVPSGMTARIIPEGSYAVFLHRGPVKNVGRTVEEIYRVWLPQSEYQHAQIADVELYDERFQCDREDSEFEIWISVARRDPRK